MASGPKGHHLFILAIFALIICAGSLHSTCAGDIPVITSWSQSAKVVKPGDVVRFEVTASGLAPLNFVWQTRGTVVGTNLWIERTFDEGSDIVAVTVFNRFGKATRQFQVDSIALPNLRTAETNVPILLGRPLSLEVYPLSLYPFPSVQWTKNTVPIPGATNYTLTRAATTLEDAGIYRLAASNAVGTNISLPFFVQILSATSPPVVIDPPAELHLAEPSSILAQTVGDGVRVTLRRQNGLLESAYAPATFQIPPTPGEFFYVATNDFGAVTSRVCRVIVHRPEEKIIFGGDIQTTSLVAAGPPYTIQPQLLQGEDVHFQWHYEYGLAISGETNRNLAFDAFAFNDTGTYELRATNFLGSSSRKFTVLAAEAFRPSLTWALNGFTTLQGESVDLYGTASNGDYQWYRNGQPIPGATNWTHSFILSPETAGIYGFKVHNIFGETESNPATVIFRGMSNAPRDFRMVADTNTFGPNVYNASISRVSDDSVTFTIDGAIYRWTRGQTEKILDSTNYTSLLPGGTWTLAATATGEDDVIDLLLTTGQGSDLKYALWEKGSQGFRVFAQTFDEIPGLPVIPGLGIQSISAPIRAGGKVAFTVSAYAYEPYNAVMVWDGTNLTRWVDSFHPLLRSMDFVYNFAFDGDSAAFFARGQPVGERYPYDALFRISATGNLERLAKRWDSVPGTTNRIFSFNGTVAVQGAKTLWAARLGPGVYNLTLLEHDATRDPAIRKALEPGSVTDGGLSVTRLDRFFRYAPDGSILFGDLANAYWPNTEPRDSDPNRISAIFRLRDGIITEELTSLHRIGGRSVGEAWPYSSGGTNFVCLTYQGLYTTAPGLERPTNAIVYLSNESNRLRASWTGEARLQQTHDREEWRDLLTSPGPLTNDLSNATSFLRLYFP